MQRLIMMTVIAWMFFMPKVMLAHAPESRSIDNWQKYMNNMSDLSSSKVNKGIDDEYMNHVQTLRREKRAAYTPVLRSKIQLEPKLYYTVLSRIDSSSLAIMLVKMVEQEMKGCDLVVAHSNTSKYSEVLDHLFMLPNPRQVTAINSDENLLGVLWESPSCVGYVFLVDGPQPLLTFTHTHRDQWDYTGRYVVVGLTLKEVELLMTSEKGRKTEHLVGVVKGGDGEGELIVYQSWHHHGVVLKRATTWRPHYFSSPAPIFPDKFQNLLGAVLKVVTFAWEPSVFYQQGTNGTVLLRYGVDVQVARLLSTVLNFTLIFVEPLPGELWGARQKDGSWSGMMGLLESGEAHMGVANLYVSISRVEALEYSAPYNLMETCLLARTEPPVPRWQALAFPFHWLTWLAILVGLVLSGPLLYLLSRPLPHSKHEPVQLVTVGTSWLYTYGLHIREPQSRVPQQARTQVLVMFLWLYTMILTIAYCTNLTAFLLVNRPPVAIETIRELSQSRLKVVGVGEFYKRALAAASDPYLKGLAEIYESEGTPNSAYQRVLSGDAVFIQNRAFVEFIARTRFTDGGNPALRIMKECFAPYNIAMGLQRHSPLKERVGQVIGRINQAGLTRHYFLQSLRMAATLNKADQGEDAGGDSEEGGVTALNLDHLQGAFLLNIFGLLMASLAFFTEITVCR